MSAALRRRFRYHAWATAQLVDAVRAEPLPAALRPLAHALTAGRVWLLRLAGEPTDAVALWPALDADGIAALARRNAEAWDALAADAHAPGGSVAYTNSRGEAFETDRGDIMEHVLLHAAYHRGQTAAALRAAGIAPPSTDFVLWLRLGEPDASL